MVSGSVQPFRVVIQFVPDADASHYRLIAYRDGRVLGPRKFHAHDQLLADLKRAKITSMPQAKPAETSRESKILYSDELWLASEQLRILGLSEKSDGFLAV